MVNKLYINPETAIDWSDATTGGAELMDAGGLAADAVVMGSFLDRGAGAQPADYMYEVTIDGFDTAPVVGESVLFYLSFSNATTNFDGNPTTDPTTTAEGTMTTDQLRNVKLVDAASVYSTTAANELKVSGIIHIPHRYVAPVLHNNTADALLSTSDAHKVVLTPIPPELQ
jgi:hypothetical protein